jgi:GSH-dependent disulfide-bond oxidoreductase
LVTIYAFATPNNLKVLLGLEEMGWSYELKSVNIRQGEQKSEFFRALNANGKVPVLVDTDGPDGELVLTESAAILVYLAEKCGQLLPAKGVTRVRTFEQLFFHASGISPAFGNSGYFQKLAPEPVPAAIERFHGEAVRLVRLLDTLLAKQSYMAGEELTIADLAHFGWFWRSAFVGLDLTDTPYLKSWYEKLLIRPAFQTAISKLEGLAPKA